jgi:hypothetical protein
MLPSPSPSPHWHWNTPPSFLTQEFLQLLPLEEGGLVEHSSLPTAKINNVFNYTSVHSYLLLNVAELDNIQEQLYFLLFPLMAIYHVFFFFYLFRLPEQNCTSMQANVLFDFMINDGSARHRT